MGGEWRSIDMVHVSLLCDLCRVPPAVRGTNISNLSKIVKNLVEEGQVSGPTQANLQKMDKLPESFI